jgi:hypothetical protein
MTSTVRDAGVADLVAGVEVIVTPASRRLVALAAAVSVADRV